MLANIAPGVKRHFAAERMAYFGKPRFDRERELAKREQEQGHENRLFGSDLSGEAIGQARANAARAGVDHLISFRRADINELTSERLSEIAGLDRLLLITNPPYGERLADHETAKRMIASLGRLVKAKSQGIAPGLRVSVLSPDEQFESIFGASADKKRKLYNGMIRCNMYHYFKYFAR